MMPSIDRAARAAICPPSRRGHSWRELSADERDIWHMIVGPKQGDATAFGLRICAICRAYGAVNKQGLITLASETGVAT
jgi:hypothetical protein